MITANIVSRPTVGDPPPPSITALISITSITTIESVRMSVPSGSPSISARWSASVTTPNAHHRIAPRIQTNRSASSGPFSSTDFDSRSPPNSANATTVPQPLIRRHIVRPALIGLHTDGHGGSAAGTPVGAGVGGEGAAAHGRRLLGAARAAGPA